MNKATRRPQRKQALPAAQKLALLLEQKARRGTRKAKAKAPVRPWAERWAEQQALRSTAATEWVDSNAPLSWRDTDNAAK